MSGFSDQVVLVGELVDRGVADIRTGPFGTQLKAADYVDAGTPVINVRNVGYGDVVTEKLEHVPDDVVRRLAHHQIQYGDVVFGRKGAIDRHAYIQHDQAGWLQGSDCIRIRFLGGEYNSRFVSFLFRTHQHRAWMLQQGSHGATMASLNQDILKRISLPVVSRGTQDRIAFVLGAFDDLIVNNSRRIEILEEMARAIYGEWFVEFRYPGHEGVPLVESELGPIPEGWEVAPLSDLSTKLTDGDWVETKDQGGDDFRLLQVSNIGVGRFRETGKFRYVTQETFDRLRCTEIEIGDILISRMPDPVGRAWLVDYLDVPAITAVDVAILTPFTPATGLYVSELLNSSATLAQMAAMATGTTRARVTRKVISAMPVLRPSEAILEKYGDIVGDFARLKSVLTRQSDSLKATRDLLLPGLVSGDINVSGLDLDDVA